MPKKEEDAKALANALMHELAFPFEMQEHHKKDMVGVLCDVPPPRSELSFQSKSTKHEHLHDAPKVRMAVEIADEDILEDMQELFCMAHGEFSTISGTDIEHATPFKTIQENQQKLLALLNSDAELAGYFLKIKEMKEFFGKDKKTGEIKGTKYFYKMCYNNISNLWLLCHACNIGKSDKDPLSWFEKQEKYFGQRFLDEVKKDGGLHPGVVMLRVGGDTKITLGKKPNAIVVHLGGKGFGEYIRNWFLTTHKDDLSLHRQFYRENFEDLKKHLESLRTLKDEGKTKEAKEYVHSISRTLSQTRAFSEGMMSASIAIPKHVKSAAQSDVVSPLRVEQRLSRTKHVGSNLATKQIHIDAIAVNIKKLYKDTTWAKLREIVTEEKCDLKQLEEIQKYLKVISQNPKSLPDETVLLDNIKSIAEPEVTKLEKKVDELSSKLDQSEKERHKAETRVSELEQKVKQLEETEKARLEKLEEMKRAHSVEIDEERISRQKAEERVEELEAKLKEMSGKEKSTADISLPPKKGQPEAPMKPANQDFVQKHKKAHQKAVTSTDTKAMMDTSNTSKKEDETKPQLPGNDKKK